MHAHADLDPSSRDRAFERLYRQYVRDVYRYTLAVLRNPADAEDITQTTFLNAYRAFQRGEEPRKPQNWLIKIAHNACRTRYLRASRRPQEVPLEESLAELAVPEDEIPDVKVVLDALARLPFNQRAALVMRELEGRSYAEIADALGVSVAAVETLIFRARRSLRVRRSALRTLAALPLPGSLSSFSGGTVAAGGGALLGSGLLLKAVVALGIGLAAGGVGTAVEAKIPRPGATVVALDTSAPTVESSAGQVTGTSTSAKRLPAAAKPRGGGPEASAPAQAARTTRQIARATKESGSAGHAPTAQVASSAAPPSAASAGSGGAPPATPAPVETATTTVAKTLPPVRVDVPPVPSAPALPPAAQAPPLPLPSLPPPPPLPPPPSLP